MTPLAALAAALLCGASPFVAEQPRVREGNEKLLGGDPAAALERYDAAAKEAGPHPEIEFDRGNALHAQGRHAEAREAWQRALEQDRAGTLSSRAWQNMGNALDAAGDRDGAARAFAEALTRDPVNEDARYNLEVLLRRKAEQKGQPKDRGSDGGKLDQGKQGQAPDERKRTGDEERREQGKQEPAGKPDAGPPQRPGEERQPAEARKPGGEQGREAARAEGLGRQDAERLLDALRARERNMPLTPAGKKAARRADGKDW